MQPHNNANGYLGGDNTGSPTDSQGYAQLTDGNLEINLAGFANTNIGAGFNTNATTDIQGVFNITNQGTETVYVNISDTDLDDDSESGTQDGYVVFYNASIAGLNDNTSASADNFEGLETDENGDWAAVEPGETLVVDIKIHIDDVEGASTWEDLIDEITIEATTSNPGSSVAVP